jgi:hypothetical protein
MIAVPMADHPTELGLGGPLAVDADLVTQMATFSRALRHRGVAVNLQDEADGLRALALIDIGDRAEVLRALVAALKIRPGDRETFVELFDLLWRGDEERPAEPAPVAPAEAQGTSSARTPENPMRHDSNSGVGAGLVPARPAPAGGDAREPGYTAEAVLRRKPFDACTAAELQSLERLLARLVRRLATRPSRRVPTPTRGEVDLRRSLRRLLATGGEPLSLAHRRRAIERPKLVALCDTSGSMDPHARFFLAFLLALRGAAPGSEVFAFNTALVRLTPWLRPGRHGTADIARTLDRLTAGVPDWSGGTRIGECLAAFVDRHLDALVDERTVILIASDGLDRGEVAPLRAAMAALHRRARRILWLNPLAGDPRYEATARAMAAALPYVDRLLPAHNLESLERLLPLLAA